MSADDKQQQLPGPSFTQRANQISKRASKQRRKVRLPVLQPNLPVADKTFEARAGVPKTRADCPTVRPCPHVLCRFALVGEDAEHRAGRPGLGQIPRDSRGLTISVKGNAGTARPGMTLRPTWLHVRGLEIEREVKLSATINENLQYDLHEVRNGTVDYWLARVHPGESIYVYCDEDEEPRMAIAKAKVTADKGIVFDRYLPSRVLGTTANLILRRARDVSSCALDLIDAQGKLTNEQTGDALGRHRTLVARETKRALRKAIDIAEGMGIGAQDLMRSFMGMGADK